MALALVAHMALDACKGTLVQAARHTGVQLHAPAQRAWLQFPCLFQHKADRPLVDSDAAQHGSEKGKAMRLQTRVQQLIREHGTLRAASRAIGVDVGYLSRLEHGDKSNPSDDFLTKLGLQKVVTYRRIAARASKGTPL